MSLHELSFSIDMKQGKGMLLSEPMTFPERFS